MRKVLSVPLIMTAFLMVLSSQGMAQSANPLETLKDYMAELQKNPDDIALREKIIQLVQSLHPAPAIPEEAREHYVMAATFVEKAKDASGYELAIEHYRAALLAAPWWSDAYRKLAIVQKAAAHYDDAVTSLKLYILTQPADIRDAQDEIYKLKALKQTAALEAEASSPPSLAKQEQKQFEDLLRKIDGRRYATWDKGRQVLVDVKGRTFVVGFINDNRSYEELYRSEIRGREFAEPVYINLPAEIGHIVEREWSISESGESITVRCRWSAGETEQLIYRWQR